jgi:hypothetical protein
MKKLFYILLLIPILSFGQKDKTIHFYAGAGISMGTGLIVDHFTHRHTLSMFSGIVVGSLAGIAKEAIYDKALHKGECDNWDAMATTWGAIIGGLVVRVKFDLDDKKQRKIDEHRNKLLYL